MNKQTQTFNFHFFFVCVISFNPSWKFLRLGNSAWVFLGVHFWSRDFLGVFLEALGIFLGFDFRLHSIIADT